jgi:hypothetical protein
MLLARPCLVLLCCLSFPAAAVDEFVPHQDGRTGGCYRSANGQLYNCVELPATAADPAAAPAREDERDEDDDGKGDDVAAPLDPRVELQALRQELEKLKQQQAADDLRRALTRQRREQAARDKDAAEQAELDAAMAAYNAIEAAKDSQRLQQLEQKTQACRAALERKGYRIVGAGACRAPDGSYVNCPEC